MKNKKEGKNSGFKTILSESPQALLEFIGLSEYTFKKVLDKSVDFIDVVNDDSDCLYETQQDKLIYIKFQCSDIAFSSDLNKSLFLSIYYRKKFNKEVIPCILYGNKVKSREVVIKTPDLVFKPYSKFLSEISARKILEDIKNEYSNTGILTEQDKLKLSMILEFNTNNEEDDLVKEVVNFIGSFKFRRDILGV